VPSNLGGGGSNSFSTYNYFSFGLSASQLVYDFGQTSGRWRAAQASAEAQRASEQVARHQVVLGARTAFFAARAQKELVRVAEQAVANQQRHHDQVQGFVEVKTRPEIDLAQARLDLANARLQLVSAQNGYAAAKAQLNLAMGVVRDTGYDVADQWFGPVDGEEARTDALVHEAMRRPDLLALAQQVRAQQLTIRGARGGYGPSVSVSTSLTDAGREIDKLAWNWSGQATLNWSIWQGGQTSAQVREAEASLVALTAQLEASRQQVRLAIEQARLAIRAAKESIGLAQVALENARVRLELAEGRYQAGVGNAIELGDAQLALTSASAQRVQAEYALATARAQMMHALGRM
jgi:outer membrane protein